MQNTLHQRLICEHCRHTNENDTLFSMLQSALPPFPTYANTA